jgi:hypothetical protein
MEKTGKAAGLSEQIDMARRSVDSWPVWLKSAARIDDPIPSVDKAHPGQSANQQMDSGSPKEL